MNIIGLIPARMGSTRFPGKPLAEILGKAMIYHVYWRSNGARVLNEVYIATCDKEINDYCLRNGMNVVMTSDRHERASDRCAEAMTRIEEKSGQRVDIVVMIQGDEPMIYPEMIEEAIGPMQKDETINVTNLTAEIRSEEEFEDPNVIKVVVDKFNNALYFSRKAIPAKKIGVVKAPRLKQVCIIPFRRDFLLEYTKMQPTSLEIAESIDMMRILENGMHVKMVFTGYETKAVDTKEDLETVSKLMMDDKLLKAYQRQ